MAVNVWSLIGVIIVAFAIYELGKAVGRWERGLELEKARVELERAQRYEITIRNGDGN